jgi:hypothetical protein
MHLAKRHNPAGWPQNNGEQQCVSNGLGVCSLLLYAALGQHKCVASVWAKEVRWALLLFGPGLVWAVPFVLLLLLLGRSWKRRTLAVTRTDRLGDRKTLDHINTIIISPSASEMEYLKITTANRVETKIPASGHTHGQFSVAQ